MSQDDLKHLAHVQERIEKLVAGLGHDVDRGAERRASVGDQFSADRAERCRLRRNELARHRYAARKYIADIERRIDQRVEVRRVRKWSAKGRTSRSNWPRWRCRGTCSGRSCG